MAMYDSRSGMVFDILSLFCWVTALKYNSNVSINRFCALSEPVAVSRRQKLQKRKAVWSVPRSELNTRR